MAKTNWRDFTDIKVGDKVEVVVGMFSPRIHEGLVIRVTHTQFSVRGDGQERRYLKRNGWAVGATPPYPRFVRRLSA